MLKLHLLIFFFLLQSSTYLANIPCEDKCIPSIAKKIVGNYSEQIAPAGVIHDIPRQVEDGRSVLTDLRTNGMQMHDRKIAQLTSGEERIARRGLFQQSDVPLMDFISMAKLRLKEFVSTFRTAISAEKDLFQNSLVSSAPAESGLAEPAVSSLGRPIAISTIPLRPDGSKPSFRFKREVMNSVRGSTSLLVSVSTLPLQTSRGLKPIFRSRRRKILSFSTGESFHNFISRSGTPVAVSSIPVLKKEEEYEVQNAVASRESAKSSFDSVLAAKKTKQVSTNGLKEDIGFLKNQLKLVDYPAVVGGLLKP